jgi:hypothetical protein
VISVTDCWSDRCIGLGVPGAATAGAVDKHIAGARTMLSATAARPILGRSNLIKPAALREGGGAPERGRGRPPEID